MKRSTRQLLALMLLAASTTALPAIAAEPASAPASQAAAVRPQQWFGVAVENIPHAMAKHMKLKAGQGLMVFAVLPNSPAERTGLKSDDLLIEINGRPLTSQNDLYLAANPRDQGQSDKASKLTFQREGDRFTIDIAPAARPADMISFDTKERPGAVAVRNYVTPSGGGAQVGPGYRINLAGADPADFTVKSIQQIVAKGQTVILSQETDAAGNVRKTITVGSKEYVVDPQNLGALPEDLRPLAMANVGGGGGRSAAAKPAAPATATAGSAATAGSLEQRVKELEEKNQRLTRQLEQLLEREGKNGSK